MAHLATALLRQLSILAEFGQQHLIVALAAHHHREYVFRRVGDEVHEHQPVLHAEGFL